MEIDKDTILAADVAELRRRAEDWLNAQRPETLFLRKETKTERLLHELQIQQIELEMQNAELRQAREYTETLLEKYTDLYDFAPVGYFTLDRSGAISAANLTAVDLLNSSRSQLIGRQFCSLLTIKDRSAFSAFLDNIFTGKEKATCEVELLSKSGSPLAVQISASLDTSGQECRLAISDISERKQAEAEIRKIASFPLMNPNPIIELDINGQMIFCNPAAQKILDNTDNDCSNPLIPEDLPLILQSMRDKQADRFLREIDINGRSFEEIIYVAPPFQTARIYTMDITDRKRAGEEIERLNTNLAAHAVELEAANIELEAFNFTVSHDLRKPLTIINSYCQVVQEQFGNRLDEEGYGYIQEMYAATVRMNRLIDTLLDFSRISRVDMRQDTVDLSSLAKEVVLELQLLEPDRLVAYRITPGMTATGDSGILKIVLNNLIGNAWKYTGRQEASIIEFGLAEAAGKPAFFIRDNGSGFDMTKAENLFAPFQRLAGGEVEGHGIGLATVERIIRRHGGRVWAESDPGNGATFFFTLAQLPGSSE